MEIHSELIAGHYTTAGRDWRKELNGRWRRALVNHYTHTTLPSEDTVSVGVATHTRPTFPTANTHETVTQSSTHSTFSNVAPFLFLIILSR